MPLNQNAGKYAVLVLTQQTFILHVDILQSWSSFFFNIVSNLQNGSNSDFRSL